MKHSAVLPAFGRLEYEIKLAVKSLSGKKFSEGMAEAESSGKFGRLCKMAKQHASENWMIRSFRRFID